MSKRHFIALADVVRTLRPVYISAHPDDQMRFAGQLDSWKAMRNALGDFCQQQNGNFNRDRWLAYIAGECGPNGGKK